MAASFRWTDENMDELITLYEANLCLYDTKSKVVMSVIFFSTNKT